MSFIKNNIFVKSIKAVYSFLPKYLKRKSYFVILALFINALVDFFGIALIFPIFSILVDDDFLNNSTISKIYDWFGFNSRDDFFIAACVVVVITIILKGLVYIFSRRYQAKFTMEVYEYYTNRMYSEVYQNGYSVIASNNSNEILRDISHIPRAFSLYIIMPMFIIFSELIVLLAILGIITYLYSSLVFIVIIPMFMVIYVFYSIVRKKLNFHERAIHEIVPENYKAVNDMVKGYSDIKIGDKFSFFKSRFKSLVSEEKQSRISLATLGDMPARVVEFGLILSIVIILLYSYFMIDDAGSRLSLLGVFGLAAFRTTPSLNKILTSIVKIKGNLFILDVVDKWSPNYQKESDKTNLSFDKSLQVKDLCASYGDNKVLDKISFEILPGEFVGIVGASGTGKSTLVKILLGLVDKKEGEILIDGEKLSNSNIQAWYSMIGYVGQDVYLLDGTLKSNVAFGEEVIDEHKLLMALEMAGLDNFVKSLENGVDTNVGENGTLISGGQKQRLGIARALYKNPRILILDESTNALDTDIERGIIDTIVHLKDSQNITILFVTHKVENLSKASKLIRL